MQNTNLTTEKQDIVSNACDVYYKSIMCDNAKYRELLSDIVQNIPEIIAVGMQSIDIQWKTYLINMHRRDPTGAASLFILEVQMNQLWLEFFAILHILNMQHIIKKWFSSCQLSKNSVQLDPIMSSNVPKKYIDLVPAEIKNEPCATKDEKPCQICFERSRKCIIFPCKHSGLCVTCSRDMEHKIKEGNQVCPFCREKVDNIISFFDV